MVCIILAIPRLQPIIILEERKRLNLRIETLLCESFYELLKNKWISSLSPLT